MASFPPSVTESGIVNRSGKKSALRARYSFSFVCLSPPKLAAIASWNRSYDRWFASGLNAVTPLIFSGWRAAKVSADVPPIEPPQRKMRPPKRRARMSSSWSVSASAVGPIHEVFAR